MRPLKTYTRLLSLEWQVAFQYRGESMVWFLFDVLPPLVMILLWRAAYQDTTDIGGYSSAQMMCYYVVLTVLQALLTSHPEWDVSYEIRMGDFSRHLLRPLSFNHYHLVGEVAWKLLRLVFIIPTFTVFVLWLGPGLFSAVTMPARHLPPFLLSLLGSYTIAYYLKISLGLTAFWATEPIGVFIFFELLRSFFAGTLIPLDLMPAWAQRLGDFLPFAYLYFFPLSILQGKLAPDAIYRGLLMQLLWAIAAYALMALLYRAGVRQYSAVGG